MEKYKVIKNGFNYNGTELLVGQVFEGEDKKQTHFDRPVISIKFIGSEAKIPSEYLEKQPDDTPITNQDTIVKYNNGLQKASQIGKLGGLGALAFVAYQRKAGVWGYISFGLLGIISGAIVGRMVYKAVAKKSR